MVKQKKLEIKLAKPIEIKPIKISEKGADFTGTTVSRKERERIWKDNYMKSCQENFSVIIDCDWDKEHSDSNLKSLSQQIMFCYGVNKRHAHPASLYLTGLGPLLNAKLSKVLFESWTGVSVSSQDYIFNTAEFSAQPQASGGQKQLVYLTSDAEEVLESLDPCCAYVIGGIVDRNRLKGATFNKATGQGVRTAKLPIKENFALSCTHVLTVNHVFEILLNFSACGSWPQAIEQVLPKRKAPVSRNAGDAEEAKTAEDGAEGEADEDDELSGDEGAAADSQTDVDEHVAKCSRND